MCVFFCWYRAPLTPKVRKVKLLVSALHIICIFVLHFSDQTSRQTNPIHLGGQSSTLEGENYADEGNDGDDDDDCLQWQWQ